MCVYVVWNCVRPVVGGVFARVLLSTEAVRVLVQAELEQRREHLGTQVTTVRQVLLVRTDVLEEELQLLEGLRARLHHTLVHLQGGYTHPGSQLQNY